MRPLCDIYNLVAETFIIIFRLVFDALGSLIDDLFDKKRQEREARRTLERKKRFIFDGLDPDTPPPAFDILEDICDIINDIIDILKDAILMIIGTVGHFVFDIVDGDISVGDVFELIGELLNFLLVDILGIPCLDFANGLSGFIDGLEDCLSDAFDFVEDLADCASEANFVDYSNCVGGLKKRRRQFFPADDDSASSSSSTRSRTRVYYKTSRDVGGERHNTTMAQRWELLADWMAGRWMNATVLPFSRGEGERQTRRGEVHSVGHSSPPVYRTPDPATSTYGQTMWMTAATVVRNLLIVFSSTSLDKETFRVMSMPYREKLRALRAMNTDLAVRDFFISFRAYTKERAESKPTSPLVANLHTMTSTIVTRLLAPHRLNATLEAFKKRGPEYVEAVKRVSSRLEALGGSELTRTQRAMVGRLRKSAAFKFSPKDFGPLFREGGGGGGKSQRKKNDVLRGTIWDITDHLEYIGHADPDSYVRQEMDAVAARWSPYNTNVSAWMEKKRMDMEKDAGRSGHDYYSVMPEQGMELRHSTANFVRGMKTVSPSDIPQVRVPIAAIALVFVKNPRFIIAALVPFLASGPGQVIIRRYLSLLQPIFGKYFSSGLTDLNAGDLLDLAEEFTDITIDNLIFVTNVFIQFLLCSYWAFILRGAAFILSFIPVIGFIFSSVANWAIAGGAIMLGNCPPDPQLDDNGAPLQNPLQYMRDILECWETSVTCASSSDCVGGAQCRCPNTELQWKTFFYTLGPSSTTDDLGGCPTAQPPTSSGYCECWPRIPCGVDTAFLGNFDNFPTFGDSFDPGDFGNETFGSDSPLLPNFSLSSIFDVDCEKEYDYETRRIVWYKEANLIKLVWFNMRNSYLGLQYLSRDWIFSFPKIQATAFTLILIIPLMLFILGNVRAAVIITFFVMAIVFGMPVFSTLTQDQIVPYLERTKKSVFFLTPIWTLLLDWMRFPNHNIANPLGSPRNGEGICFLLNSPATLGGAGFIASAGILLYYFFFISIFLGILAFLFAVFSAPFRIIWNIGACYVFYTNAYDVYLSRRQGHYIEAEFTSGGGLGPESTMEEVSRFSSTGIVVTAPRTSRHHHHHRRKRPKRRPYVTEPDDDDDDRPPTGFIDLIKKEVSPPTFRDIWNSVYEPLFRAPQARPYVSAYGGGRGSTIVELTTTTTPERKDV